MAQINVDSAFNVGQIIANVINEKPQAKPLQMDFKKFDKFSADGVKFDFKPYKNESVMGTSIITSQCWNLEQIETDPCPDAYFEVTFTDFNPYQKNPRVGVGIGNQIFTNEGQLGRQQNSFGYFNNGYLQHNGETYNGFLPPFGENDTIGAGVLYDSFNTRRLYFTKNGQYLGVAPIQVHDGQDCFPGVTFVNDAYAKFSVNLTGPFKFNAKTLPNHRHDKTDRISKLPSEILFECIDRASNSCFVALSLRMTNKRLNEMAKDNRIWKRLFLAKFPWQNKDLNLRSWMKLYERRAAVLKSASVKKTLDAKFIENCDFEFECPITWPKLNSGDPEQKTVECNKCHKTVYSVATVGELYEHTKMGHCVSLVPPEEEERPPRRGRYIVRKKKTVDDE